MEGVMNGIVVLESANPMAAYARRQVGKREWKVSITELMESEGRGVQVLRAIGNRHPNDTETQRLVAQGSLEVSDRLLKLNELLHYKGEEHGGINGIGTNGKESNA